MKVFICYDNNTKYSWRDLHRFYRLNTEVIQQDFTAWIYDLRKHNILQEVK